MPSTLTCHFSCIGHSSNYYMQLVCHIQAARNVTSLDEFLCALKFIEDKVQKEEAKKTAIDGEQNAAPAAGSRAAATVPAKKKPKTTSYGQRAQDAL
jgi:hypothetical protein